MADLLNVFEEARRTQADFLKIDLDTALILADRARRAEHPEDRDRNRRNARRAYDTVLSFLANATVGEPDTHEINTRLKRLKSELKSLGEDV